MTGIELHSVFKALAFRRPWVAQSVKHQIPDLGSGHDLMVHRFEPHVRFWADSVEPAWDPLSSSLSAPPLLALSLSK